jgi:hypothetical protein
VHGPDVVYIQLDTLLCCACKTARAHVKAVQESELTTL